nr:MAG TPA: hypothetical protein [Caudoviricetes sp.]
MKQLKTIKNIPNEIAAHLAADPALVRLLVDDSQDLSTEIERSDYSLETLLAKKYLCTYPIVESDGLVDSTKNTFLVIKLTLVSFSSGDDVEVSGNIYITSNLNHYLLKGGKDRNFEICDRLCQDLDGLKLTATQTIDIGNIVSIAVGNDRAGYCRSFEVKDQLTSNMKAEI